MKIYKISAVKAKHTEIINAPIHTIGCGTLFGKNLHISFDTGGIGKIRYMVRITEAEFLRMVNLYENEKTI